MHINNKSTNRTTLNLTIKLHAQYKIIVWTTCTYKSHTDAWNVTNLTTVLWLIASKSDDVTLRPLNWRRSDGTSCCCLTMLLLDASWKVCQNCPKDFLRSWVPCARGSRLLQNAQHDLCKNRSFAEDDGGDCYIVTNLFYIFIKSALYDRSVNRL